jgi:hypothetical protein
MEEIFQVAPQDNGGKLTLNYGAIKELKAWVADKKLFVETESDRSVRTKRLSSTRTRDSGTSSRKRQASPQKSA